MYGTIGVNMKFNWSFSIYSVLTITLLIATAPWAQGQEVTNSAQDQSGESQSEVIATSAANTDWSDHLVESSGSFVSSKHTTSRESAFALLIMVVGLGYFYQSVRGRGEAQRRIKSLVTADEENQLVLIQGNQQFEQHFQKFTEAWANKIEEIGQPSELEEEEEQRAKREKFNQWLQKYLDSYRSYERELLVMRILDPIYVELMLLELPQKKNQERDCVWKWSVEALSMYKTVKPYLSDSSAKMYAQPLLGFYELVIKEAMKNARGEEEIEKLKQEFEETLEIEESQRI